MNDAAEPTLSVPAGGDGQWRLVLHGGSGVMVRERMTAEQDRAVRAALQAALEVGGEILAAGGSALDAVEATAAALEDDPHFNAGHGSVFTYQGTIEMDASIMEGASRDAGAVNGVTATRNPVRLARAVMEDSPHVFLSREGADEFSRLKGLDQAPPEYFHTAERREQLDRVRSRAGDDFFDIDVKYGTVGAVARDAKGHVAAATSTGGLTGKRWGRIGDSPVIGAGIYADDRGCAVSATGAGEYFLRVGVAHEISARIRFERALIGAQQSGGSPSDLLAGDDALANIVLPRARVQEIVDSVLDEVARLGGTGGVIVVTPWGDSAFSFNTPGMYRGEAGPGHKRVAIYGDEDD